MEFENRSTVDVVIVNWNAGDQLQKCVQSIIRHSIAFTDQIIVVDNNSTDGSESAIENLPEVTLIRASENMGFGAACNLGAGYAHNEYLLFLNPDAYLVSDSLKKVLNYIHTPQNADVGICGIQLLETECEVARSCARFPTALGYVAQAFGLDRIIPTFGHFMREWDHASTKKVDHVIGAFFLVRRSVFETLNGFDERFFLYLEDLDFSFRAKQLGWSSIYFADTHAFHAGGGTSRQVKAKRLFYSLRSRILYAFKHFTTFGAMTVLLVTLFIEPISRIALGLCHFSVKSLKETSLGYLNLLRWLPSWILKGQTR